MKAIANTTLSLGLINLPVQVAQAMETANDVTFKQAGPNGESLRQAYLLPDNTECPRGSMTKGIEMGGAFHQVKTEDVEAIAAATKIEGLPISEVVPAEELWSRAHRIKGLYFIQCPKKNGNINAFKLFVDALEQDGKVMVTKWTARSRQQQLVIWPKDGLLMASAVSFAGDEREADEDVRRHLAGTYSDAEMEQARQLLSIMSQDRSTALDMEVDDAIVLKHKLVDDALSGAGVDVTAQAAPQTTPVNALADALTASIAAMQAKAAA